MRQWIAARLFARSRKQPTKNRDTKLYVDETIPVLKAHLEMIGMYGVTSRRQVPRLAPQVITSQAIANKRKLLCVPF
jgi:hypothetical protein